MPQLSSSFSTMALPSAGLKKLGHPVPDSNLWSESNSARPQPAHWYCPFSWRSQYSPENARSVPFSRRTKQAMWGSSSRHSASDLLTVVVLSVRACSPSEAAPCALHDGAMAQQAIRRREWRLCFVMASCVVCSDAPLGTLPFWTARIVPLFPGCPSRPARHHVFRRQDPGLRCGQPPP